MRQANWATRPSALIAAVVLAAMTIGGDGPPAPQLALEDLARPLSR